MFLIITSFMLNFLYLFIKNNLNVSAYKKGQFSWSFLYIFIPQIFYLFYHPPEKKYEPIVTSVIVS